MNYELCKKLKEVGFPQILNEGDWYYSDGNINRHDIGDKKGIAYLVHSDCHFEDYAYPSLNNKENEFTGEITKIPNLHELIEACGDRIVLQSPGSRNASEESVSFERWTAIKQLKVLGNIAESEGDTPEEAVANLWLNLNQSSVTED